ncbi:hypothetical protein [Amycolatopsis sp. NPDC004378]
MNEQELERLLTTIRARQGDALFTSATPPQARGADRRPPASRKPECSTGKPRFPTEAAARARLDEMYGRSYSGRLYGPIDVYSCRKCTGWHLTAKQKMKPCQRGKRRH